MAIHKLFIDDFEDVDYQLLAIHTTLDDFRIEYYINQKLPILLSKCKKDILIETDKQKTAFTHFNFEDKKKSVFWTLIENKKEISLLQKNNTVNLFNAQQEFTNTYYLLPELKKVDYFLKIEGDENQINTSSITNKLKTIDQVTTVYPVKKSQLKSKNNLIF